MVRGVTVLTVDIANSREVLRCVLDSLQKSFGRGRPVRGCTNRSMRAESSRVRAGYGSVRGKRGQRDESDGGYVVAFQFVGLFYSTSCKRTWRGVGNTVQYNTLQYLQIQQALL
jgi:hypothetical protein